MTPGASTAEDKNKNPTNPNPERFQQQQCEMSNLFRNAREPQTAPGDISSFPGEVLAQVPSSSRTELPPHNPLGKEKGSAATLGLKSLLGEAREAGWQCPSRQGTGDLLQKYPWAACHHAVSPP